MFLKMYGDRFPSSLFDKSLKTIITTVTKISFMIELPTELIKIIIGGFLRRTFSCYPFSVYFP